MKNVMIFIVVLLGYLIAKPMQNEWQMSIIKYIPIVSLLFGIAYFSLHEKKYFYYGRLKFHFGYVAASFLVVLFAFSILNSNINPQFATLSSKAKRILSLILFGYFTYLFINVLFRKNDFETANKLLLFSIVGAPGLLILLNIILYALGFSKTYVDVDDGTMLGTTPGVLSTLLGFNFNRDAFLFSEHPNNYAVVVGVTLLVLGIVFVQMRLSKVEKVIFIVLIASCFFSLLILDSRSSFASTVFALVAVFALKKTRSFPILYVLVLLLPFFPYIIKNFLAYLSNFEFFIESMSRSGSVRDILTANSRVYIWDVIIDRFSDLKLNENLFFGYGEYGHFGSKDVNKWAWAFGPTVAHNFCYQILYDMGYLGVAAFMAVLLWMVYTNINIMYKQNTMSTLFMGFIVYYLLSGIFESTFGIYYDMYTTLFFLFVFANVNLLNEYLKHNEKQSTANKLANSFLSKEAKHPLPSFAIDEGCEYIK